VPVSREKADERRVDIVHESDVRSDHEEPDWTEFERELWDRGMIVLRSGENSEDIDVVGRSEVISRATVESEAVEETLMEGETVESEITERRVVEHVVVEEATVQSETVDREVVESAIVDANLLMTDVQQCSVARVEPPDQSTTDLTWFQPGTQLEDPCDVEIDVNEGWELVREVIKRITIESRIVDTDVEETVGTDTLHETVDLAATVAAAETDTPPEHTADTELVAGEPAAEEPESADSVTTDEDIRVTPMEGEEGKTVVNPDGEEVGMVVAVDGGQMYVDLHPPITDRIRTVLGWSDHGDDSYLLVTDHIDHIDRIDDDQVVLRMEHELE
jgi:hypothetical protein